VQAFLIKYEDLQSIGGKLKSEVRLENDFRYTVGNF
jgi:hypothetical protein